MTSLMQYRPIDYPSKEGKVHSGILRYKYSGSVPMHKLAAVEDAKRLFNEGKDWSAWRWLIEKKHARTSADAAWEALEAGEEKVKADWNEEWREAYGHPKSRRFAAVDPEVKAALERLHKDDEEARQARDSAEAQFDRSEER